MLIQVARSGNFTAPVQNLRTARMSLRGQTVRAQFQAGENVFGALGVGLRFFAELRIGLVVHRSADERRERAAASRELDFVAGLFENLDRRDRGARARGESPRRPRFPPRITSPSDRSAMPSCTLPWISVKISTARCRALARLRVLALREVRLAETAHGFGETELVAELVGEIFGLLQVRDRALRVAEAVERLAEVREDERDAVAIARFFRRPRTPRGRARTLCDRLVDLARRCRGC